MASVVYSATDTWQCPAGITSVTVECWGGGGAGGGASSASIGGGGGGGGAYSISTLTLTPGTIYTVTVGAGAAGVSAANGGTGGDSWFSTTGTILAKGGGGGLFNTAAGGGAGGASGSGVGTTKFSGGAGGTGQNLATGTGGGGGGGAGNAAVGGAGGNGGVGVGGTAGAGGNAGGGAGAVGVITGAGNAGNAPGGAGSGASTTATSRAGGAGATGQVIVSWADTASFPNLIDSYVVVSPTSSAASLVTPTFTPANGEVIVIKASAEGTTPIPGTPTGGSQTYTAQVTDSTASTAYGRLYTAVISGSPAAFAITVPWTSTAGWHSMVVERWGNAQLAGTPATADTRGTGAPTTTLTTVANNSIVSWFNGDFAAIAPTSRAYRSSAKEDGLHDKSTANYVAYFAFQEATTAGSQTLGLTAPTGETYKVIGIEIESAVVAPTVATYYFDASDSGPTDPNSVWTNDANAFDGSTSTSAITTTLGTAILNYLSGGGTTAPTSGGTITQVRGRAFISTPDNQPVDITITTVGGAETLANFNASANVSPAFSGYTTLTVPAAGWTWTTVNNLVTLFFGTSAASQVNVYRVEIEVTSIPSVITVSGSTLMMMGMG